VTSLHVGGSADPGAGTLANRVAPILSARRRMMSWWGCVDVNALRLASSSQTDRVQNRLRSTSAFSAYPTRPGVVASWRWIRNVFQKDPGIDR
jgi:hypothetical protein